MQYKKSSIIRALKSQLKNEIAQSTVKVNECKHRITIEIVLQTLPNIYKYEEIIYLHDGNKLPQHTIEYHIKNINKIFGQEKIKLQEFIQIASIEIAS